MKYLYKHADSIKDLIAQVYVKYQLRQQHDPLTHIGQDGLNRAKSFVEHCKTLSDEAALEYFVDQVKNGLETSNTFRQMLIRAYHEHKMASYSAFKQFFLSMIYDLQEASPFYSPDYFPILRKTFDTTEAAFQRIIYSAIVKQTIPIPTYFENKYLKFFDLSKMPRDLALLVEDSIQTYLQETSATENTTNRDQVSALLPFLNNKAALIEKINSVIFSNENHPLKMSLARDLTLYYGIPEQTIHAKTSWISSIWNTESAKFNARCEMLKAIKENPVELSARESTTNNPPMNIQPFIRSPNSPALYRLPQPLQAPHKLQAELSPSSSYRKS